jgi:hypothetical protein
MSQVISHSRDAFELACGRWETKDGRNASQADIIELFRTIVQQIPNCTFVVDGLDECAWAEEKWKSNNNDKAPIRSFIKMVVVTHRGMNDVSIQTATSNAKMNIRDPIEWAEPRIIA